MKVRARAPGKIILSGEHAVVHGSTAVAASINLYSVASLDLSSGNISCLFFILILIISFKYIWCSNVVYFSLFSHYQLMLH